MRKIQLLILSMLISIISFDMEAQKFTKSYAVVSCNSSMGPQAPPLNMAIWIDFYDGYLVLNGNRYRYTTTNWDGSKQYYPVAPGNAALSTIGVLVSSDYSSVREIQQSSMMGITLQISYDYSYIGEGSQPAINYSGAGARSYIYGGGNDSDSAKSCHSCYGSGACKLCGGSGYSQYERNGRCGGCRGTGKCAGCNGKGYY